MMKGGIILTKYEYDAKCSKKQCNDNNIKLSWRDLL